MKQIDTIELKNISLENDEDDYSYGNVIADVYVNGECKIGNGYCDLSTFMCDSHSEEGKYHYAPESKYSYRKPMRNLRSNYGEVDKHIPSLTAEELDSLPKNSYFRRKKKNKILRKKRNNMILNKDYLLDRVYRNNYFQDHKKHSHYYLDTCSCGHAGCAGIWNGVMINRKGNNMVYSVSDGLKNGYHKGILGSGKFKIVISLKNLQQIRNQLKPFFK